MKRRWSSLLRSVASAMMTTMMTLVLLIACSSSSSAYSSSSLRHPRPAIARTTATCGRRFPPTTTRCLPSLSSSLSLSLFAHLLPPNPSQKKYAPPSTPLYASSLAEMADQRRRHRRRDDDDDDDDDDDEAFLRRQYIQQQQQQQQQQQHQQQQQQQQQRPRPDSSSSSSSSSVRIALSREERELFALLRLAAIETGMSSTRMRVAGGWVRDKILAPTKSSGGRVAVTASSSGGGGVDVASDSSRWTSSSSFSSSSSTSLAGTVPVDIDITLDDRHGLDFANRINEYLSSNDNMLLVPCPAKYVGIVQINPEKSKHLETASMRLGRYWIDFVNLRAEEYYVSDSRIPESTRIGNVVEDAYRRDLTINSLFYNINDGIIEDMTGRGLDDLRNGIIDTPSSPLKTLLDDPLRVLRAVRFAARLRFVVSDPLREAATDIRVRVALERKVSRERIGIEVDLMLRGRDPVGAMGLLVDLGLVETVFPPPPPPPPPPPLSPQTTTTVASDDASRFYYRGAYREGLALLGTAHDRLCVNSSNPPRWCEAGRAIKAGAVNGIGEDESLVLTNDEDARRMLWYAAFLKPLRDRSAAGRANGGGRDIDDDDYDDDDGAEDGRTRKTTSTRKANRSAVLKLLVDDLKRPIREAEAVERIMKAADGFTRLVSTGGDVSALPVLLSGARVYHAAVDGGISVDGRKKRGGGGDGDCGGIFCTMDNRLVDPDTEDDPVWKHNMEFRTNCADVLRDIEQLWRAAFVLSMCEQLVRWEDHKIEYTCGGELVREAPEEVASGIINDYNEFAAAMVQLGLIGIWNQRPSLNGVEIEGSVLPNVPRGPDFRRVMDAQTRWLTSHPGGKRERLVEHLRSAFPEFT